VRNSGFFQKVYALVANIPKGKVTTYGAIAARLGGFYSGRTVGFAMRAAPPERKLPCHRVVNKKGEMAPGHVFGGAACQRALLKKEGVPFLPDGRIDIAKAQADLFGMRV
jgi:O-6-methylguanine DNA methyltransferase